MELWRLKEQSKLYGAKAHNLARAHQALSVFDSVTIPRLAKVFSEDRVDQIPLVYRNMSNHFVGQKYIVRSSFEGEDSATDSCAGKYKSIVTDYDGLGKAAQEVLASGGEDLNKNVLVHHYIDAKLSGEYFTANPDNNPDLPDLWTSVPGNGGSVEGDKTVYSQKAPDIFRGLGLHLVDYFQGHLDIEWVIDQKNRLWIVQVRPITKMATRKVEIANGLGVLNEYAKGVALVVNDPEIEIDLPQNYILVAPHTNRRWENLMRHASGLVTDHGTSTCHASIFSREIGLPAVIGTLDSTTKIMTGDRLYLNTLTDPGYGMVHKEILHG